MQKSPTNPDVTVCICTFRRPTLLERALEAVGRQETGGQFRYSIVVADNDASGSAEAVVVELRKRLLVPVVYCLEANQNISLARNAALAAVCSEFVAFIDDDEFPERDWLQTMLRACIERQVAGVLGPVRPHFDHAPPPWVVRGRLCERREYATGTILRSSQTRTGNALLRCSILPSDEPAFRPEFGNGGEDDDFFRRLMARGHTFIWCNEGVVHEVVPPERCTRKYFLKRALLRGQNQILLLSARSIAKSLLAVPVYAVLLPFAMLRGEHVAMQFAIRVMDHAGKLCVALGVRPVAGRYLNG